MFNSTHKVDTTRLTELCTTTYELIVLKFNWVNITPSLHKLLAHSPELIATYNSGYGLKKISEEGLEALNKYVRKYRESLARKLSFESNIKDVLVRLTTQSDPVLLRYRISTAPKLRSTKNEQFKDLSFQDQLVNWLLRCTNDDHQGCMDCINK